MEGTFSEVSGLRYHARTLTVASAGRGTTEITAEVQRIVAEAGVQGGLCNVFIHHTSASLIVCENADPSVRSDLEAFAARLAPDGDPLFEHTAEGPDDMSAHVRSVLTQTSLSLPISGGRCALGTWQGVYLWEHRHRGHRRTITVSVIGA
jgi:secondary thiamine-phosphate synthase enzyme